MPRRRPHASGTELGTWRISIVVPVHREEGNIARLIKALDDALAGESKAYDFEYVFVNDGSPDHSLAVLSYFADHHPRCKVVDLSKNFGKEIALTAGLNYASGDAVICIDADLQHPPHYIPQLLRLWEQGNDVVSAVRKKTDKEGLIRKVGSRVFYLIMNRFTDLEMDSCTTDFRILDRSVVDALRQIGEKQRIFRGLIDWLGFQRATIEFEAPTRQHGEASYSFQKLAQLAINSFVSYSTFPLKFVGIIGAAVTTLSGLLLTWMLIVRFMFGDHTTFTPLAIFTVGNTFLFGIVVSMLGLISLYIRKIYAETLNRPLFVVRSTLGFQKTSHTLDLAQQKD